MEEHAKYTSRWLAEIGRRNLDVPITTANASVDDVWRAAQEVYHDAPELLEFVKTFLNKSIVEEMKIWHGGKLSAEHGPFLQGHRIRIKPIFRDTNSDKPSFYEFIIDEDNPAWAEVKRKLGGKHTYILTEFTADEIIETDCAIVWATHSIEPVRCGGFAWSEEYIADQCGNCGTGWRQIAPFRIKKEPKLGNNVFADFGSAFELFCAPVALEAFKKQGISGFETQPLILNKEDRPAEYLKQLVVTEVA